jgi:hypothetical protein
VTGPSPDLLVADDTAPEESFAALVVAVSRTEEGSGWLTWEPHEGADTVRTDAVVFFAPHRHFPLGEDEPWADTALGGGPFGGRAPEVCRHLPPRSGGPPALERRFRKPGDLTRCPCPGR